MGLGGKSLFPLLSYVALSSALLPYSFTVHSLPSLVQRRSNSYIMGGSYRISQRKTNYLSKGRVL